MKLIKLNESQYKRLFEASETLIGLGGTDESQNPLPHNVGQTDVSAAGTEITDKDGGHKFQDQLGGVKPGPDGKLGKNSFADNLSNNGNLANRR